MLLNASLVCRLVSLPALVFLVNWSVMSGGLNRFGLIFFFLARMLHTSEVVVCSHTDSESLWENELVSSKSVSFLGENAPTL